MMRAMIHSTKPMSPPSEEVLQLRLSNAQLAGQAQLKQKFTRNSLAPNDPRGKSTKGYDAKNTDQFSLLKLKKSFEQHLERDDLMLDGRRSLTMEQYQEMADNALAKATEEIMKRPKKSNSRSSSKNKSNNSSESEGRSTKRQKSRDLKQAKSLKSIYYQK